MAPQRRPAIAAAARPDRRHEADVTTTDAPASQRGSLGQREFVAFMALLSAASAIAIDTILPAFGEMRDAFGLDPESTRLSLTITLFFLGTGVGLFVAGPLADAVGRRKVLVLSLSLYGLGAIGAALAPNLAVLYLSRFVWGFAAAGPRILSQAILRDRFDGQELARAMTLVMTFFYIAPVLGPVVGKGILELGGWRWVFGSCALLAVGLIGWGTRLPETLDPANRRPFSPGATAEGLRRAAANPVTRSYGLAVVFGFGAFYAFLGSIELIVSDIYDRPGIFVWIFALFSSGMGLMAFVANRALRRVRAQDWTLGAGIVFLVASAGLLAVTSLAGDGRPPLALFIVLFGAATLGFAAVFPTANSIALHPMGALAGTAAAGLGAATTIISALLASLIDRSIDGSITPLAVGYTVYAAASLACQLVGRRQLVAAGQEST